MSVIVAHIPRTGYKDEDIEDMYDRIGTLLKEARNKRRITLIGGDWNAEVASMADSGKMKSVGHFANSVGNPRGHARKILLLRILFLTNAGNGCGRTFIMAKKGKLIML
mgnify:CR=1 FL=1